MDKRKLVAEVVARHGIRLDEDDPAMVLVTLTELMLDQARTQFEKSAQKTVSDLNEAAEQIQQVAGEAGALAVKRAVRDAGLYTDGGVSGRSTLMAMLGAVAGASLLLLGIWIGKAGLL